MVPVRGIFSDPGLQVAGLCTARAFGCRGPSACPIFLAASGFPGRLWDLRPRRPFRNFNRRVFRAQARAGLKDWSGGCDVSRGTLRNLATPLAQKGIDVNDFT